MTFDGSTSSSVALTPSSTHEIEAVEPAPVEKKHRGITEVLVGLVKRA